MQWSNLFCPCERSEIGEVPQGEGVKKTLQRCRFPVRSGHEPQRLWLVLIRGNTEEQKGYFFCPCGASPLTNSLQFWVHIGPNDPRFCFKYPQKYIRLLNLTKFSNRGGNLVFLYLLLQQISIFLPVAYRHGAVC